MLYIFEVFPPSQKEHIKQKLFIVGSSPVPIFHVEMVFMLRSMVCSLQLSPKMIEEFLQYWILKA